MEFLGARDIAPEVVLFLRISNRDHLDITRLCRSYMYLQILTTSVEWSPQLSGIGFALNKERFRVQPR